MLIVCKQDEGNRFGAVSQNNLSHQGECDCLMYLLMH